MSFIKVTKLNKHFDKKSVIKNLTLKFESGHVYLIEGPSGCGKTTLLNLIIGIEKTDSGQIILNNHSLGYLPQNFQLMNELSVIENIALPLWIKGVSKQKAFLQANLFLKKINMSAYAHKNSRTLSGGEKQRVAFARALATGPDVLLLDEPFNQVDSQNLKKLIRVIDDWMDLDKICLWVKHDTQKIKFSKKIKTKLIQFK